MIDNNAATFGLMGDDPAYAVRRVAVDTRAKKLHRYVDQMRMERRSRLDAMWQRFRPLAIVQGLATSEELDRHSRYESRRGLMVSFLRRGLPAGFRFASMLEAIDVGLEDEFLPHPAEPTAAPIGSREKLSVFCRRIEHGQELFHQDDNRRGYPAATDFQEVA